MLVVVPGKVSINEVRSSIGVADVPVLTWRSELRSKRNGSLAKMRFQMAGMA